MNNPVNKANNFCLHLVRRRNKNAPVIGSAVKSALKQKRRQSNFDSDRRHPQGWVLPASDFSPGGFFFEHPIPDSGISLIRNMAGPASAGAGVSGARGQKTPHQTRKKTNSLIKWRLRFSFSLFSFMGYRAALFFLGGFFCFSVLCFSFSQVPMQAITTR